jgi:hypothetical protein
VVGIAVVVSRLVVVSRVVEAVVSRRVVVVVSDLIVDALVSRATLPALVTLVVDPRDAQAAAATTRSAGQQRAMIRERYILPPSLGATRHVGDRRAPPDALHAIPRLRTGAFRFSDFRKQVLGNWSRRTS